MKLESLSLANYRGFDQIDLRCEHDVTVIAGVNGVGKSALLSAIVKCASHALSRITTSKEDTVGTTATDVKTNKNVLSVSAVFKTSITDVYVDISRSAGVSPLEAKELTERRNDLRFATRETKKGSKEELAIKEEIHLIESKLASVEELPTVRELPVEPNHETHDQKIKWRTATQPFVVFYSTSRLLSRLPPSLPKTKGIEIASAYNKALDQLEISLNDFANWYRVLSEEGNEGRSKLIFQQLEAAISYFLQNVNGLQLHADRPPRFSVNKNGDTFFLEQLSDGERGLLALVFDLTRRLATANPESDNPIAEGVALVLIDEIELHLHPKWQRDAIKRLPSIFKNSQFVITTHSPQVLGEVQARCVRLLSIKGGRIISETPGMAYGTDSNWILNVLMGADGMNEDVEKELENISRLISERKLNDARAKADDLRSRVGNTEAIQKLASTIERIERLGK